MREAVAPASRLRHLADLPRISRETLTEMIGATRSRVNLFLNKFKELGFIEHNGGFELFAAFRTVATPERDSS